MEEKHSKPLYSYAFSFLSRIVFTCFVSLFCFQNTHVGIYGSRSKTIVVSIYKPYHLLLLAGASLIVMALIGPKETIDIHVQDTYFVIAR